MDLMLKHPIISGTSGSFGVPAEKEDKRETFDVEGLDGYALERWEVCKVFYQPTGTGSHCFQTILYYMVSSGTGQHPTKPSQGVLFLLQQSGLMASPQYVDSV